MDEDLALAEGHRLIGLPGRMLQGVARGTRVEEDRIGVLWLGVGNGLAWSRAAISAAVRTTTPIGLLKWARRRDSSSALTVAGLALLSNTILPLAI
jgi:hypothetical protein